MVFSKKWLRNHPKFLLHFLIHIDVHMLCRKFELIPTEIFRVMAILNSNKFSEKSQDYSPWFWPNFIKTEIEGILCFITFPDTCTCSLFLFYFQILSFSSPYILPPDGSPHTVLVLQFNPQSSDCLFNSTLRLATNMSFFNIPLQCYDGRLDVSLLTFTNNDILMIY